MECSGVDTQRYRVQQQGFTMYSTPDDRVLIQSEFAVKMLLNICANAAGGVLTCVRLPHESGKVPVRLLFDNAMKLSCSTNRSHVIQG